MTGIRSLLIIGYALWMPGQFSLFAGQTNQTVLVAITVTDTTGAAIPYAQIKLLSQHVTAQRNPETNGAGEASLKVIPGTYDLVVTSPDFVPWAKSLQAEAIAALTLRVVLQPARMTQIVRNCSPCPPVEIAGSPKPPTVPSSSVPSSSVSIAVTDAGGTAIPYAQIGIDPKPNDWGLLNEADESGKFSVRLEPGNYDLAVTSPGFQRRTQRIELKEKENRTVKVVVEPGVCLPGPCRFLK